MPDPTDRNTVAVIGYGTVGKSQVKEMRDKGLDDIYTVDIDKNKGADYLSIPNLLKDHTPDVYIILVWTPETVLEVIKKIPTTNKPLISIESTVIPGTFAKAKEIVNYKCPIVIFQERIYPNDQNHGTFNQKRVMAGNWDIGRDFYMRYMIYENIVVTDNNEMAELSHIMDNCWRYLIISAAQTLARELGIDDYAELRRVVNTKWNLDMPEVREGIGGHCLPKDMDLLLNQTALKDDPFFNLAYNENLSFIKLQKHLRGELE